MMTIVEYARHIGRSPYTVRNNVTKGRYKTAKMIGGKWYIDENEMFEDRRLKSGAYIGWRQKLKKNQPEE